MNKKDFVNKVKENFEDILFNFDIIKWHGGRYNSLQDALKEVKRCQPIVYECMNYILKNNLIICGTGVYRKEVNGALLDKII